MGGLTINRKRGFDYFNHAANSLHSSSSSSVPPNNNNNINNNSPSSSNKKPKISPLTHHHIPLSSSSSSPQQQRQQLLKGKSRYYSYPEPVTEFKREVHAPCTLLKFASFRTPTLIINNLTHWRTNAYNNNNNNNVDDDTGNVLGVSQDETENRVSIKSPLFWNDKEEHQPINVDDIERGDIQFVDTDIENSYIGTDKDADSELENNDNNNDNNRGIENKTSWDIDSFNQKMILLGRRPVYKVLWEDAERISPKLSSLSFDIELTEKRLKQFQLLRPVKLPVEQVVSEDALREAFLPLSKEEKAEVSRAFSDSNRRKVLATHDNSNIAITGEILRCLRPKEWLNDEVINVYMELLKERERRDPKKYLNCHFFNTFFYKKLCSGQNKYDYKSVRRWTTQRKLGYALKDCDKIFVPIHRPYHWCLAIINKKERKLQYLDSLGGTDSNVLNALARYYVEEVKDKSGENIDVSSWQLENVTDLPVQKNGFDCGVFMVKYTDFYSRGLGLCFKQDNMPYFRLRTAKEILRLRAE